MAPTTMEILKIIASLVLVFGLLGGLLWALKRMQSRLQRSGPQRQIAIIETLTLAPRQKIALVQIGHQQVLVGITPTQINALITVTPAAAANPLAEQGTRQAIKEEMKRA